MTAPTAKPTRSPGFSKELLQLLRIVLGFIAVTLGGYFFVGADMLSLYLISIVCTLGVGLVVFWLPAWWGVGYMLVGLAQMARRSAGAAGVPASSGSAASTAAPATPALNPYQQAGVVFIRQSRAAGVDDDVTRGHLLVGGWTAAQADEVMALAK